VHSAAAEPLLTTSADASETVAAPPAHSQAPTIGDASDLSGWHQPEDAPSAWELAEPAEEQDWQTLDREDAPAAADEGAGWQESGSVGSVSGPDAAFAAEPHITGGSDAAASNGGASHTAESPDVAAAPAAAEQSELEQWQSYATQLEAQVAAAQADVSAWAEAHSELSLRLAQTEEALTVRPSLDATLQNFAILPRISPGLHPDLAGFLPYVS
jgi:hypothetical protein